MMTSLLSLILVIAIIGVIVWFIITYLPMPAPFRGGIMALAAIVILIVLLKNLGGLL